MYIDLNPWTISLNFRDFKHLVSLAVSSGFGGIELTSEVLQSRETALDAAEEISRSGLKWGLFGLPCDFSNSDETGYRKAMKALQKILPLAELAGCTRCYNHIWPGSDQRTYMANFRWHVARFKSLAELLGEYGVSLGIEFIGPKTLRDSFRYPFVHTLEEALELADAISPSVGIALDMFHLYTSGGTIKDLQAHLPIDRIVVVHANDAAAGRPREEQMDMERAMPFSTGVIDSVRIVKWLVEGGYNGPILAEPFYPSNTRFKSMQAEDTAGEVGACMRDLLNRAGV